MSDLICRKTLMRCQTPGMCAPYGGCTPQPVAESVFKVDYAALIEQAKSAPAEPLSREAMEYQQLSRWGCWDRIEKDVFDLGVLGHTPERFRALYTAPPSPDAELVELLRDMVAMMDSGDEHGAGSEWHTEAVAALARIDAKLASLKP